MNQYKTIIIIIMRKVNSVQMEKAKTYAVVIICAMVKSMVIKEEVIESWQLLLNNGIISDNRSIR